MSWWSILLFVVLLWVAFNWIAPLIVVAQAKRMTVASLPGEILFRANMHKVRYYRTQLHGGYAFTVWGWPYKFIVLDEDFLKQSPPSVIRFVLAHELGHCVLGHTFKKWLCVVTGLIFIPAVLRWLESGENEADKFAETLSGVPRVVLRGTVNE